MFENRFFRCLKGLSATELSAFRRFLSSPYFNSRGDLLLVFDQMQSIIQEDQHLTKEMMWQRVFPAKPFVEKELRLLLTYLQRLFEKFIAVENLVGNKIEIKLQTASWYRTKGFDKLHKSTLKDTQKQLDGQSLRNGEYFYFSFQKEFENYRMSSRSKPDSTTDFQKVVDNFDLAFLSMKLRQSCLMMLHDSVYKWGFDPGFLEQVFEFLQQKKLIDIPAINIYYCCYHMIKFPKEEVWFQKFKKSLVDHGHLFKKSEIQDLFLLAVNYGIRKVNDGHRNYFHDIMDFYRIGLKNEYLIQEDGFLSRFTYNNIISTALQIDQIDWAEQFIEDWTPRLEKRFRERMYSFNMAKIAYARKDYDAAIPFLQRSNYHDLLLNLGARTLLLKIYHELGEYDLLHSHLDAFNSYIRRKKGLGYHRKNYRNLIKYTNRLLALNLGDRKMVGNLKEAINKEEILTERDWLLSRLAG